MYKSCNFQIKNGRFTPPTATVEKLITYNQQYNILEDRSQIIVETDIKLKTTNEKYETIKHQTLVELSGFNHGLFEIDEATTTLMFNLRHNIFEKIKSELGLNDDKYLYEHFPNDYNVDEFSCMLNKDLKFDDLNFQPQFNLNLLTHIDY